MDVLVRYVRNPRLFLPCRSVHTLPSRLKVITVNLIRQQLNLEETMSKLDGDSVISAGGVKGHTAEATFSRGSDYPLANNGALAA